MWKIGGERQNMNALTERQWCAKARRHPDWEAAWHAEIAALEERIEGVDDILSVQEIIDRAAGIEKRIKRLKRIMARHLERLPGRFLCLDSVSAPHNIAIGDSLSTSTACAPDRPQCASLA
jgi:hypothetical protein